MLITDYLFENVKPIWDAYLEHDFIMDMGNGNPVSYTHLTLPTNREV